jgi:predicted tellurium resistance membrane protein TerC
VCWKLWRDIRDAAAAKAAQDKAGDCLNKTEQTYSPDAHKAMVRRAVWQIAAADLSMSLDNVLAVAGAARNHVVVLAVGLMLSIGLMGIAASVIAKVLHKYPWISYAGLFIVLYVAVTMVWRGGMMILNAM